MLFDLISTKNYTSKIDDFVFDDIGMQTLFDDFYDHNWMDLMDVMEYIPREDEIRKRQEIFTDFLNDKDDLFKDFKRLLEELKDALKTYMSNDGGLKAYIHYCQYIEKFINFIDNGNIILNKLSFGSKELNNLKEFFNKKVVNDEYLRLKEDNKKTIESYKNMEKFFASYVTNDKFIKTNIYKKQTYLYDELKDIINGLGIDTPNDDQNQVRHDLDAYYFNRLEYLYPDDYKALKSFYDQYKEKIVYDYDRISMELNFYMKIKLLFLHEQSKGVPFCKVEIANERVTDIHDLADYTIVNKVDYIQTNDFHYDTIHHMQIVTGANGGGKTTYLRSIGANYIMFSCLGYCFAKSASIYPVAYIHTHFPNDENYQVGYGRLQDELRRIDAIRNDFSIDCLYLLNETFSSTDEETAFKETKVLFKDMEENHVNMVYITHQQILLQYIDREKITLLNPIVDVDDNNRRTFKIRKVNNEIHAFANDILRKYGLSKDMLEKRKKNV